MMKDLIKKFMIYAIIVNMIQIPLISLSYAGGFSGSDIKSLADTALGAYGNFMGQKQQMLQQQISSANNQKLMSQLSPACRKPDGTACYTIPAKYFPECPLPASMTNMPQNVCSNPTPEVNQISSMITYESVALGWMNYYDQMSNEASNSKFTVGLRCLADKQKAMDSQLTEMVNSLQRLQDKMNQDKQIFRDNNKKLLEDMNTANEELYGSTKNNLNLKTQDFAKNFSQNCQSVIGKDVLKEGGAIGLNKILQGLGPSNKSAADFDLNKVVIENDIRRETNKIASTISANGVEDFLNKGYIPQNDENAKTFGAIGNQIQKQKTEFATAKARIDKVLRDVGYEAPPLDSQFSADFEDFIAGSNDFFQKKYVNDCVTGASSGIAIPIDDIMKSIEQKSTRSSGTARDDYRIALKKILDSAAMMDDKMVSIKDLQTKFPDITITYKDNSQARVTESPYTLFMKTIEKCKERYIQDDKFSSKGASGVSYQKKVTRAKAALQELKNLNDSYSSKVTQGILSQVLDCGGSPLKSGSCSEETLNSGKENFCLSHASACANEIQGCYAEANTLVQTKKTKMQNLAKTFNTNVAAMIAQSNALFEQQKASVVNITKFIQSKFPGTNFEIPKDMFIPMPELKKDAFGVEMAADGDLKSFLDGENSMPVKIEKLKLMFQAQKVAVKKESDEYIGLQKEAMTREKSRWEKLHNDCKGAVDSSSRALAKMNEDGMKRQGEEDSKVAKFCKKYDSIRANPVGGCGKAQDLAELADQIAGRLTNQSLALSEQYASACDGFGNQNDDLASKCDNLVPEKMTAGERRDCAELSSKNGKNSGSNKSKKISFSSLCGSGDKQDSDFIATAAKYLSIKDRDILKGSSTLAEVMEKIEKQNIADNEFFNNIASLISSDTPICSQLKKIVNDETKKKNLNEYFSDLASVNIQTPEQIKATTLSQIGEQMSNQCDMQSNSNITKNTGFDLKSFDASVLGAAR